MHGTIWAKSISVTQVDVCVWRFGSQQLLCFFVRRLLCSLCRRHLHTLTFHNIVTFFCMQDGEGEKKAGTSRVRENGELSGIAFFVPVSNFGAAKEKDEEEESEFFVGDCVRHMAALLECDMVLQAVSGCCQPKHRNRSSSKELQATWPK